MTAHRIIVSSTTRAADAGHLAAADIAQVADLIGAEYRLIGGNAVSLLVWCHDAAGLAPWRETVDADLGMSSETIAAPELAMELGSLGYRREGGNQFVRSLPRPDGDLELQIDVLAPSFTGQMQSNVRVGDLYVDEVPGLGLALARPAVNVLIDTTLTTGEQLQYPVKIPDVVSALCMKAYSYRWRFRPRDALDVWRLLEVGHKVGLTVEAWPSGATGRQAARYLHQFFAGRGGGIGDATDDPTGQARLRALVQEIVPALQG